MSRQISYFIEGGDNVGKTTLINYIKEYKKYEESMGFIFNKYPSKHNTEFMNVINDVLKLCEEDNRSELYSRVNDLRINTMIKDMLKSFNETEGYINISDRGPLSTFLYNYIKDPIYDTITNFNVFILKYLIPIYKEYACVNYSYNLESAIGNTNIIILNNNKPDIPIVSDKKEDIEYKKNFDNDCMLQDRINSDIQDIVKAIDNNPDISILTYPFKLYYINIYHIDGTRKTTEEVFDEFRKIIYITIEEEKRYE